MRLATTHGYARLSRRQDLFGLAQQLPDGESAWRRWVVESSHFTVPSPLPERHLPSEWAMGTRRVAAVLEEAIRLQGGAAFAAVLLGDLAHPPEARKKLPGLALAADFSDVMIVLESAARNRGKRNFDAFRHALQSADELGALYEALGAAFFRIEGRDGSFFTFAPVQRRFNMTPGYAQVTKNGNAVPLCPLIIAGKYLELFEKKATNVVAIYDRREDSDIRAKNFWGAGLALTLATIQGSPASAGVAVNVTLVDDDWAWVDTVRRSETNGPLEPESLTELLEELRAAGHGEVPGPYFTGASK